MKNDRMHELYASACLHAREQQLDITDKDVPAFVECMAEKFAELIVEECRNVVTEVYRNTPLELCGPLLTADEKIAKHFYGVEE